MSQSNLILMMLFMNPPILYHLKLLLTVLAVIHQNQIMTLHVGYPILMTFVYRSTLRTSQWVVVNKFMRFQLSFLGESSRAETTVEETFWTAVCLQWFKKVKKQTNKKQVLIVEKISKSHWFTQFVMQINMQIDIVTYKLLFFLPDTSLCLFGDELYSS